MLGLERICMSLDDAQSDAKYWFGSIWIGFEDGRYHCKGQKRLEEPDPEPNKGLDPGSTEPVSHTNTALIVSKLRN